MHLHAFALYNLASSFHWLWPFLKCSFWFVVSVRVLDNGVVHVGLSLGRES
jgi:hypothetical protein